MSIKVSKLVWAHSTAAGSERLMLLAIADFADDSGSAYPSISTLARMCGTGARNAMYLLKALQERGELRVDRNAGRRGTNVYQIVLPEMQASSLLNPAAPAQGSAPLQSSSPLNPSAGAELSSGLHFSRREPDGIAPGSQADP